LAEHPAELTRDQILFLTASMSRRLEQRQVSSLAAEGVTRIVVTEGEEESE